MRVHAEGRVGLSRVCMAGAVAGKTGRFKLQEHRPLHMHRHCFAMLCLPYNPVKPPAPAHVQSTRRLPPCLPTGA